EQPQECGGHVLLLVGHPGRRRTPPCRQALRGPCQRAVEMAEVAGVRTPGLEARRDARAVDAVAADRFEQSERRVRHVAVLAATPSLAGAWWVCSAPRARMSSWHGEHAPSPSSSGFS